MQQESYFLAGNQKHRGLYLLSLIYFGSILFATLLAPLIYWLVQLLFSYYNSNLLNYLAHKDFHDYVDRIRWIPILLCFPLLIKHLNKSSLLEIIQDKHINFKKELRLGILLGSLIMAGIIFSHFLFGNISLKQNLSIPFLTKTLITTLIACSIISILEEFIFRGIILRLFYSTLGNHFGILLAALFFAYTHFGMPDYLWYNTDQVVTFKNSFYVGFWMIFGIFKDINPIAFINIFLLGFTTGFLFIKRRSLFTSIGLHFSIILFIELFRKCFHINTLSYKLWLGTEMIIDGILPGLLLLTTLLCYCANPWTSNK